MLPEAWPNEDRRLPDRLGPNQAHPAARRLFGHGPGGEEHPEHGTFLDKNVLSSFGPDGKLLGLGTLHPNQLEAVAAANAAGKARNATRAVKNTAKAKPG